MNKKELKELLMEYKQLATRQGIIAAGDKNWNEFVDIEIKIKDIQNKILSLSSEE